MREMDTGTYTGECAVLVLKKKTTGMEQRAEHRNKYRAVCCVCTAKTTGKLPRALSSAVHSRRAFMSVLKLSSE
jgi:hypothetical protein